VRISQTGPTIVSYVFDSDDDETPTPDSVNLSILDSAGIEIAGPFTATLVDVEARYSVDARSMPLGPVQLEWTGVFGGAERIDIVPGEIVGAHFFTIKDARNADKQLSDVTRFPASKIRQYRDAVADEFERISGRSFVPRVRRVQLTTTGHDAAWLGVLDARALRAVTVNGTAGVVADYALDENGVLTGLSALSEGSTVVAEVEYGFTVPPGDIRDNAITRLRSLIAAEKTGVPDRATQYEPTDGGVFRLATPGMGGFETGIPDVDACLSRYTNDILYDILGVAG
jgi:hypothetical protein